MALLAHNVYFKLIDSSPAAVQHLVDACKSKLSIQPGIVFFAAGRLEPELDRHVNDRDFDVGLHLVFESRAAHDAYQDDPTHCQFIEDNRTNWSSVRVFDSLVETK